MTTDPIDTQRKFSQLDNDVHDIYLMISAIRGDQMRHNNRFAELGTQYDTIASRIEHVDLKLSGRMDKLDAKIDDVDTRLTGRMDKLDTKIDDVHDKLDAKIDMVHHTLGSKIDLVLTRLGAP